jgi:hypothetical protein
MEGAVPCLSLPPLSISSAGARTLSAHVTPGASEANLARQE